MAFGALVQLQHPDVMVSAGGKSSSYNFYLSCDIYLQVRVKINRLVGQVKLLNSDEESLGTGKRPSSLYVTAELCAYGEALGLPSRTPFAECFGGNTQWASWITFPIKYRDLAQDAQLVVTVWEVAEGHPERALGGTTLRLFSKKGRLKVGRQSLRLWLGRQADASSPSATSGKAPLAQRGELGRVDQVVKRYNRGEIPRIDWLDHLTLAHVERLHHQEAENTNGNAKVTVELELPDFPHAVMYQQAAVLHGPGPAPVTGIQPRALTSTSQAPAEGSLFNLHDPEVGWDNPTEKKAQKLARSVTRGLVDRDLKPDTEERRRIATLLLYPPNRPLSGEERVLVWRFRWSLTNEKRALTKVLQCVDWGDVQEARQAGELLREWTAIDVADALELLSPAFPNPEVRAHAVEVLRRTDDEELRYYLLQLVQALRYEAVDDSRLATFIVQRATINPVLGILLHWYLYTEWEDPVFGPRAAYVHTKFQNAKASSEILASISKQMGLMAQLRHIVADLKGVRGGAVRKAERLREMLEDYGQCGDLQELRCPLPLDPSVHLAGIIPQECSVFKSALAPLMLSFRTVVPSGADVRAPSSQTVSPPTADAPLGGNLLEEQGRYMVIYKRGDDLRQDQLVVQMFSLMDRLFKRENLDLRLTPYRVLPTSSEDGLIECVPSVALARVLAEHKTINRFLALKNADAAGPLGLRAEALDTFVRSCAGYCVMTYILGVGDRHLDNLMITSDARLFHIDFGFIMGRDPKPFPPPMKICKEMVDAMGGADSEAYRKFRTLACEAYNILRKSASLLVSLFHLMAGASIPDISSDPEKAMLKLQEKLRLDVDDETAVEWMQQLINESATALMPQLLEHGHRWAQYWR